MSRSEEIRKLAKNIVKASEGISDLPRRADFHIRYAKKLKDLYNVCKKDELFSQIIGVEYNQLALVMLKVKTYEIAMEIKDKLESSGFKATVYGSTFSLSNQVEVKFWD